MKRFQLIELHEQPWFPAGWRELFQLSLGRVGHLMGPIDGLAERVRELLVRIRPGAVLELCSGSGEFSASFWKKVTLPLPDSERPALILSDLYPNLDSFERVKEEFGEMISYEPEPVNALKPPANHASTWMMLESLHHFRPADVMEILRAATTKTDGFISIELTQRTWRHLAFVAFAAPVMAAVSISFLLRPFRWRNLLWGLVIPVLPLTLTFDGIVSDLRTYSPNELEEMAKSASADDFRWEIGAVDIKNTPGLKATYLFGWRE